MTQGRANGSSSTTAEMQARESKEGGMLTNAEMQEILARSKNAQDLVIPLEAKTWSRQQFELFVLSSGTIRPKGCSVPDEYELVS